MAKDPYYQHLSALGKDAIRKKNAAGETMHLAPFGWKNVRINGRSVTVRDPSSYSLIQLAKRLRQRGWSIRRICQAMKLKVLRSKRGGPVAPKAMWNALKNLEES